MKTLSHRPILPSAQDAEIADALRGILIAHMRPEQPLTLRICDQETPILLSASAVTLLLRILDAIAAGQRATIIPENAEITTFQAADILNVSRPYVIKLLDEGVIPHRRVGTHRRIRLEDLLTYKERDDRERDKVMDELVRLSQDMGMYPHP